MTKKSFEIDTIEAEEALASAKLSGLKKRINANSWTNHLEDLMKNWGEKAAGLRYMHEFAGGKWKKFNNKLTLLSIGITTIASTVSLSTANLEDNNNRTIMMYFVGAINIISTLLQSLKKFYEAEEKAAEHKSISKQFASYYRYMILQLGMSREDRRSSDELGDWSLKEFERLQSEAPSISNKIIDIFKNKFENKGQNMPDICEDRYIITIYGRSNNILDNSNNILDNSNNILDNSNNILDNSNNILDNSNN